MGNRVCYMGDTAADQAALYLRGIMTHFGIAFDYLDSATAPWDDFARRPYGLYVVSDYPAAVWSADQMGVVCDRVAAGEAGLLMIGGWESFHGQLGEYPGAPLADALPVIMEDSDDRANYAQPCLIHRVAAHEIVDGLPFDRPPGIGGRNRFRARPGAQVVLTSVPFEVEILDGAFRFAPLGPGDPLLVLGAWGRGRVAALGTDVAPHWVGGFVDWGDGRIIQTVDNAFIEVGAWYGAFFRNLLLWTGQLHKG